MSKLSVSLRHSVDLDDARLVELVDQLTDRLQQDDHSAVAALLAANPDYADELRQIMSAMQGLEAIGCLVEQKPPNEDDKEKEPPPQLGDFRILRELGRGGMGVVYEAEQISLSRKVALKVLPFAATLDHRHLQRFKNEAQAAAHLHHQNIVPVYAVGSERGVHYYAMQFIEGQTLAAVVAELQRVERDRDASPERTEVYKSPPASKNHEPPSTESPAKAAETKDRSDSLSAEQSVRSSSYLRKVAKLGVQTAEALEHAHQMGVVHRDIKPSNLLLDVRGNVWITDFGLAQMQSDTKLTLTGDMLGTLRYMSPEQAQVEPSPVDHRTDVYSLGATLYELMTLQPAVAGTTRKEILHNIEFADPPSLRQLNGSVPPELETILIKALAKNPAERFASAQEMADDLRRYLEDKPILARRPSLWQHLRKWLRRHRTAVTAAATAGTIGLLIAIVVLVISLNNLESAYSQLQHENELKQQALIEKEIALKGEQAALKKEKAANEEMRSAQKKEKRVFSIYSIALSDRESQMENYHAADQILASCPKEFRHWEWHYLKRTMNADERRMVLPTDHPIVAPIAMSANTKYFAVRGFGSTVRVFETGTGKEVGHFDQEALFGRLAMAPDGKRIAMSSVNRLKSLLVVDVKTGKETPMQFPQAAGGLLRRAILSQLVFDAKGQKLAAVVPGTTGIVVFDSETGKRLQSFPPPTGTAHRTAFSPCGKMLAYLCQERGRIGSKTVVTKSEIYISQLGNGRVLHVLSGHTGAIEEFRFSPDSKFLATSGEDKTVKIWDLASGKAIRMLRAHQDAITSIAFSPDCRWLASGGADKQIKIWDLVSGKEVRTLLGHENAVYHLQFDPDGKRLFSLSADRTIRTWRIDSDSNPLTFPSGSDRLEFSPDGKWLLTAGRYGPEGQVPYSIGMLVWDMENASKPGHEFAGKVGDVIFTPEGVEVVMTETAYDAETKAKRVRLKRFDVRMPEKLLYDRVFDNSVLGIGLVQFLADGRCMAVLRKRKDKRIAQVIADLTNDRELTSAPLTYSLTAIRTDGNYAAISHRRTDAATRKITRFVEIWNLEKGKKKLVLDRQTGVSGPTTSGHLICAFRPDNEHVATFNRASLGHESTVNIYDIHSGDLINTFSGHFNIIQFSPSGKWLACLASYANSLPILKIRDVQTGNLIHTLRGHSEKISALAFSPDETRLVTGSADKTLKLWEMKLGRELLTLRGHTAEIKRIAIHPQGTHIASVDADGVLKIWNGTPWQETPGRVIHAEVKKAKSNDD